MDDTTDPRAVEAWEAARDACIGDDHGHFDEDTPVAIVASYGDQRAAEERERVIRWLRRHWEGELSANMHVQNAAGAFMACVERGDYLKGDGDE